MSQTEITDIENYWWVKDPRRPELPAHHSAPTRQQQTPTAKRGEANQQTNDDEYQKGGNCEAQQ